MRELDETDRTLLRLLLEDARQPYSDLAEAVEFSPPAVADRIDRLRETGIIRRFTVDVDRSRLREGVRLLVTFEAAAGRADEVRAELATVDAVEHLLVTAEGDVVAVVTVPGGDVERQLSSVYDTGAVVGVDVAPLVDSDWRPGLETATLGLSCAECDNTVTSEGVTAEIGGEQYAFCCTSCRSRFEERYAELEEGA